MASWRVFPISNKDKLRQFLDQDRPLCAYALGDLEEPYWTQAEYIGAETNDELRGLALLYYGFSVPILSYFGDPAGLAAMRSIILRESEIHYILEPEAYRAICQWYEPIKPEPMWRMVVPRVRFKPRGVKKARRLGREYVTALQAVLGGVSDAPLDAALLEHGVFYGVRRDMEIVAVAGTHVVARGEGVAAVGYVYTVPEHRNKGYATACTAAVTRELLDMGLHTVVLNVAQDNVAAIKVYKRLGYREYRPLVEGDGLPR
jgi:RimJ/RimL family protein N-acetyltransferase